MTEIWKTIANHENYMVSSIGNIKSLSYNKTGKEKTLTPCVDGKGYLFVCLNGKQLRVHRLVASAFIPNPRNLHIVNHKDEDKMNNKASNLEWCTPKYNLEYNNNRAHVDEAHRKKVVRMENGEAVKEYGSITEASRDMKCSINAISRCLNGYSKTSCGYEWKYI